MSERMRAAERVMDVLELLAGHPEGMPLGEIARELSIAKAGAQGLLSVLVGRDFVEEIFGTDHYRLRLKLSALGFRLVSQTGLLDICQPIIDKLAADTGELIRMALADHDGLRWVAKAQGSRFGLRYDPDMGSPLILHVTASGRAWLATLPADEVQSIMKERGFGVPDRFGRQKIKSVAELERELERTRGRGYGLTVGEVESGTSAVAMAIQIGSGKRSPGTISVLGPVGRMSPLDIEEIIRKLGFAVQEVGELWPIIEVYQSSIVD